MITPHAGRTFGILSLLILVVLLGLVWFGVVPPSTYWAIFLVALAMVMMRITVRLVLQRDRRIHDASKLDSKNTPPVKSQGGP